ncbi:MAG: HNH endonuclease [Firmicutes bacterium]|nr:HNH endonuclease [Bacillota bacterium]
MSKKSKNIFTIEGDGITISHPEWDFVAFATIRDDYLEEIQSVTWSKKGNYLYNEKLGGYLHLYIMRKWYGDEMCEQMKSNGYVVDHMDNNGRNCYIENLCFLAEDENKAKGLTVDKMSKEKTHIALSMFKDFSTDLKQITIVFNYPAVAKISTLDSPAVIELAYLLYDCEYEMVINDARTILLDYMKRNVFEPEKLHNVDYHIEGTYRKPYSKKTYDEYIKSGRSVCFFVKKAPMLGWNLKEPKNFFHLRRVE